MLVFDAPSSYTVSAQTFTKVFTKNASVAGSAALLVFMPTSVLTNSRHHLRTCLEVSRFPLQVLTSVLSYYTRGKPPLTFNCPGKTPADYWGKSSGETELLFFKGELLHGCMDKAQYGKFGLVHAVQVRPSTLNPKTYP